MMHSKKILLYSFFVFFCAPNILCMELDDSKKFAPPGMLSAVVEHPDFLPKLDCVSQVNFFATCKEYGKYKEKGNHFINLDSYDYVKMLHLSARKKLALKFEIFRRCEGASNQLVRQNIQKSFGISSEETCSSVLMPLFGRSCAKKYFNGSSTKIRCNGKYYTCLLAYEGLFLDQNAPLLHLLFKQGYDPETDKNFPVQMLTAVKGENCEVMKVMHKNGKFFHESNENAELSYRNEYEWKTHYRDGYSLLHFAAEINNYNLVKAVAALYKDVNRKSEHGHTPLAHAILSSCPAAVEALLDCPGIEVRHADVQNAVLGQHWDIFKLLCNSCKVDMRSRNYLGDETIVHMIVRFADKDIVEFLCTGFDVDVSSQNAEGNTPLHVAVMRNTSEVVEVLCGKCTADTIGIKNKNGETVLDVAYTMQGRENIIEILKKKLEEHATA